MEWSVVGPLGEVCGGSPKEARAMRATKTMHVDVKPEQVFSFILDLTATPKGMSMEVVL